jgi:hypothetical protein
MAVSWIAVKHVGNFRRGHIYTAQQLGVLGRMAVKAGLLVPAPEEPKPKAKPKPVRKKLNQNQRRKRGWADGEVAVQAGGGQELRDDSGP